MILVDTNIWIDFFRDRKRCSALSQLMTERRILLHPWVLGELILGHLGPDRKNVLEDLASLPRAPTHSLEDIISFIEAEKLFGKGLSLIDAQLIYVALLNDCMLWTRDKSLLLLAKRYKKVYD